ncbi:hypothetical protein [Salinarimonas rosea]|uniref:hypothetical protein n=1 Tax=Salinarimonas rosea TaxID=552063 RepID=UPI000490F49F|nr:hypothetical protein [Salinarimonas rosea]
MTTVDLTTLREMALDAWAAGRPHGEILALVGRSGAWLWATLAYARAAGDQRAARGYRSKRHVDAIRETVLILWDLDIEGGSIAEAAGISRDYVDALVRRARKAGDPRARRRYRDWAPERTGEWTTIRERALRLVREGYAPDAIVSIIGGRRRSVGEALARAGIRTSEPRAAA